MPQKLTYEQWEKAVDTAMYAIGGIGKDDLEDANWHDMYEDGKSPTAAAKKVYNKQKREMGF